MAGESGLINDPGVPAESAGPTQGAAMGRPEPGEPDCGGAELLVIQEAARLLAHLNQPELVFGGMLRLMSQILGLNRGRIVLPDPESKTLRIRHAYGLTQAERERGVYRSGEGVTGRVMRTGQVAVVQNIDDEPVYLTRAVDRSALPNETVSFLAVPILHGQTTLGVLAAHRLRQRLRPFTRDLALMQILASFIAQVLRVNELIAERTARLAEENAALKQALQQQDQEVGSGRAHGILGDSPALKQALRQAIHVAPTQATVLLSGESGTGKERFARLVHLHSQRRDGPFMALNCAAIPENLLESELFGHERGAFTGAVATKKGVVELASGGTLFLYEIGDLAFDRQSKLLHVLEKQLIRRVGGVKDVPVEVRIIAATHKNLQKAVNQGRFRIDLFYRLNVFPIHLPPLRERAGDVRELVRHFLQMASQEFDRNTRLDPGVLERLERYNWPGNIRQLENVMKRAVLLARDGCVRVEDIDLILDHEAHIDGHIEAGSRAPDTTWPAASEPPRVPSSATMAGFAPGPVGQGQVGLRPYAWVRAEEAESLRAALAHAGGNKTRAAAALGMTVRQFRYRMVKLGLGD